MKITTSWLFVIYLLSALTLCSASSAGNKLVLATGEWEPITGSKLNNHGLAAEIVKEAFNSQGVDIKTVFYPWKRCETALQQKKVDAIFPYTLTDERSQKYDASDTILVLRSHFFFVKSRIKDLKFEKYEDLRSYKFGGVQGYFYQSVFREAKLDVSYVTYDDQNVKKALSGRIDIFVMPYISGWYLLKNKFPNDYDKFDSVEYDLKEQKPSDEKIGTRLLTLKGDKKGKEIITLFNKGLKTIKQNKVYDNLLLKYGIPLDNKNSKNLTKQ